MTPKEKAEELVDIYIKVTKTFDEIYGFCDDLETAKICTIIVVNEILLAGEDVDEFADAYWIQVKKEIEKL